MLSNSELKDLHRQWNEYWKEETQKKRKQEIMFMNTLTCIRLLFKQQRIIKLKLRWRKGNSRFPKTKMAVGGVRENPVRGRPKKQL